MLVNNSKILVVTDERYNSLIS